MAQQPKSLSERLAQASSVEEQAQLMIEWLEERPDQKLLFRLRFLYGRMHRRGTVLFLNYPRVADYLLEFLRGGDTAARGVQPCAVRGQHAANAVPHLGRALHPARQ
jgi:hypothetical protein